MLTKNLLPVHLKIALDLTHTAHTCARTGIQRVCLALDADLSRKNLSTSVTYDPFQRIWRPLDKHEKTSLYVRPIAKHRKLSWPTAARWRGRARRWFGLGSTHIPDSLGLIVPEFFGPDVTRELPSLMARLSGPRVALFHDAIPLKLSHFSPRTTITRFPDYLQALVQFDGIAAVSESSRDDLLDYWQWAGWTDHPPVACIPLGIDPPPATVSTPLTAGSYPLVLCVGTLEGRKNHLALLICCEALWSSGLNFELRIVGMLQRETGQTAAAEIARLKAIGRPLRYDGPVDDVELESAYSACTFTVYPSLMEGFGLPVLESLARGKPCVCLGKGALGESARGGGCFVLSEVTSSALAGAIRELLTNPTTLHRLQTEARARRFRTWDDYTDDLLAWMNTLQRRSS